MPVEYLWINNIDFFVTFSICLLKLKFLSRAPSLITFWNFFIMVKGILKIRNIMVKGILKIRNIMVKCILKIRNIMVKGIQKIR